MNFLLWVIFGGISGWLASVLMGTNANQGFLGNIIVGILGAIIGGYLMSHFGKVGITGLNLYSLLVAVIGAIVLTIIFKFIW